VVPISVLRAVYGSCCQASEKEKKQKHQKKCFEHRRTFVPFVVSVDGMFAPEAVNTMKHLAQLLSEKWRLPTSVTLHYVKSRMSVAVVRATNLCLRGTHMKNHTLDDAIFGMKRVSTVFTISISEQALPLLTTLARHSQEIKTRIMPLYC